MQYTNADMLGHSRSSVVLQKITWTALWLATSVTLSGAEPDIEWSDMLYPGLLVPEDEPALFQYTAEDTEVAFLTHGLWRSQAGIGGGFILQPEDFGPSPQLGTIQAGFLPSPFSSQVEISTSVWLENRYFVATEFADDLEPRSMLLGYRGRQQELLQSAVMGYGRFTYPQFPGIPADTGETPFPGLQLHVRSDAWENHTLFSLHQGEWEEQYFHKGGSAVPEKIALSLPKEPVEFVLPDRDIPQESLQIWIEDSHGELTGYPDAHGDFAGRDFRPARPEKDFRFYSNTGKLEIYTQGAILVYYEKNGFAIGSSQLGRDSVVKLPDQGWPHTTPADIPELIDFAWNSLEWKNELGRHGLDPEQFRYTIDTSSGTYTALLLHDRNRYSPFGRYNRFPLPNSANGSEQRSFLLSPGDAPASLRISSEQKTLELVWTGSDPQHPAWRLPLFWFPDLVRQTASPLTPEILIFGKGERPAAETAELALPADTVPGSVQVYRNGRAVSNFTYQQETNMVSVYPPLGDNELLYVRYYQAKDDGDPLIRLRSGTQGSIGTNMRWRFSQQGYWAMPPQGSPDAQPRTAQMAASLSGGGKHYSWQTTAQARSTAFESAEPRRFITWDGLQQFSVPLQGIRTAAPPQRIATADQLFTNLNHSDRGELRYRYSPELQHNRVAITEISAERLRQLHDKNYDFAVADGHKTGPYVVDISKDTLFTVLEYYMPREGQWIGAQLLTGNVSALSEAQSFTFDVYWYDSAAEAEATQFFLQFGTPDEDLDADSILDGGSRGIPFHTADGRTLFSSFHGALANQLTNDGPLTEDWNQDGRLTPGTPAGSWSEELTFDITSLIQANGSKQRVSLDLSHLSAAARTQLRESTGLRIIGINPEDAAVSGIFAAGNWQFHRPAIGTLSENLSIDTHADGLRVSGQPSAFTDGGINGPVHIQPSTQGGTAKFTLYGDTEVDIISRIVLFTAAGTPITSDITIPAGERISTELQIPEQSASLETYEISFSLKKPEAIEFLAEEYRIEIVLGHPEYHEESTEISADVEAEFQFARPDDWIYGPIYAPHMQLKGNIAPLSGSIDITSGTGAGPLYLENGLQLNTLHDESDAVFQLRTYTYHLAFPYNGAAIPLKTPVISSTAARSPAATAVISTDNRLQFSHSVSTYPGTASPVDRSIDIFSGIWVSASESLPLKAFWGLDGTANSQQLSQASQLYIGWGEPVKPTAGIEVYYSHTGVPGLFPLVNPYMLVYPLPLESMFERHLSHSLETNLALTSSIQLSTSMKMNSRVYGSDASSSTDRSGNAKLDATLGWGDFDTSPFILTYDISRDIQLKRTKAPLDATRPLRSIAEDTQWLVDAISPYARLVFALPLGDVLVGHMDDFSRSSSDERLRIEYQHNFSLERTASTTVADMFIPQLSRLQVTRVLRDSPAGKSDTRKATLKLRNRAANLFGVFGSMPVFAWYDMDDFTLSAALTAEFPEPTYTLTPQLYGNFARASEFDLGVRVGWNANFNKNANTFENDGEVMVEYHRIMAASLDFTAFSDAQLRHGPSVTLAYTREHNHKQESLRVLYSLRLTGSDLAEIGSEIEIGGLQRHIQDSPDTFRDFAAAFRIYGLVKW